MQGKTFAESSDGEPLGSLKRITNIEKRYAFWLLLGRTVRIMAKVREKELEGFEISGEMAAVLATIESLSENAIPATIARYLFLEPHTISQHLSKLQKQGFILKAKDMDKKNLVRVRLTEAGKRALGNANRRRSVGRMVSVLSDNEIQTMWTSLAKLRNKALQELGTRKPVLDPPSDPLSIGVSIGTAATTPVPPKS